jgi:hypothetical protein
VETVSNSAFSETSRKKKLLEMNNNIWAKYSRKGITHLNTAFIKLEDVITHGRIQLTIKIMVHAIKTAAMEIRRKRPSGSFAKKSGRKAIKGAVIFREADGSSKGPRKAGRC